MRERRRETHFSYLKNIVQHDILLNFKGNSIWLLISLFIKCKNMQSKCIRKVDGTSALSSQKLTLQVIQPFRLSIRGEINTILKQFTFCNFVWGKNGNFLQLPKPRANICKLVVFISILRCQKAPAPKTLSQLLQRP